MTTNYNENNEYLKPVEFDTAHKTTISVVTVDKLQKSTRKQADKCAICLERLTYNRRNLHETSCGHKFHSLCFRNIKETTCPCCRKEVEREPIRKIFELKTELNYTKQKEYREAHLNYIDLNTSNDRIDHLKLLLQREREENIRIKETSKNSRLYYKYLKNKIIDRLQSVRLEIKRKTKEK